MTRTLTVLFAGEEAAGIGALRALARSGHRLVAVLAGGGTSAGTTTVAEVAADLGLPVWPAALVEGPALAERMREERVDLFLNVHSLFIVHPEVLAAPRIGSFNLHPGPLPAYAGLNAPSWAILNGERSHATTLHRMTSEVDAGPIAYESPFELLPTDTGLSVSAKCVRHGLPLLDRLLAEAAGDADVPALPQERAARRVFGREVPYGGCMPWALPASRLADLVRACDYFPFRSPWGHPASSIGGRPVAVTKARRTHEPCAAEPGTVGAVREAGVMVATGDEWLLVQRLEVEGRFVDASSVLAPGQRLATPGDDVGNRPLPLPSQGERAVPEGGFRDTREGSVQTHTVSAWRR